MIPFFIYLIKSTLSISVLYMLFWLTIRHDKTHAINRFLLLGILVVSAIIPFLNFQFFYKEIPLKQVEVVREFISTPISSQIISVPESNMEVASKVISYNPFVILYILVIAALLVRLSISVISVIQIIKKAEKRKIRRIVLAVIKDLIHPFSFFNRIVLSEKDFNENRDIVIAHEHAHIKQLHAIDLVICELFTVLHFFNPFMWLLRRDLKLIHEYQADQAVLNNAIESKKYQLLILEKAVGERRFAMANRFTQKPILKRIKMMHKKSNKRISQVKLVLFVPLLVLLLQAFARPELIKSTEEFIPVKYSEDETEKWLSKWTVENIGHGFFQPGMRSVDATRKQNNVLVIFINKKNEFLVEAKKAEGDEIKGITKDFIAGLNPDGTQGPDYEEKEIPFAGKINVSKGSVFFRHDVASSKEVINNTLRQIGEAFLEARNKKAKILFSEEYFSLENEKRDAVDMAVPIWFSIGEPKKRGTPDPPPPISIKLDIDGMLQLYDGKKKYTLTEFEELLYKIDKSARDKYKEYGYEDFYKLDVSIKADSGVSIKYIDELKKILRASRVSHIKYNPNRSSENGAASRNYFLISDEIYSIGYVVVSNESNEDDGKFGIFFVPKEQEKDIQFQLYSIKSNSKDRPEVGIYEFDNWNFNNRNNNTWFGNAKIDGIEFGFKKGTLQIVNNSIDKFSFKFDFEFLDGARILGQYEGEIDFKDLTKS